MTYEDISWLTDDQFLHRMGVDLDEYWGTDVTPEQKQLGAAFEEVAKRLKVKAGELRVLTPERVVEALDAVTGRKNSKMMAIAAMMDYLSRTGQ